MATMTYHDCECVYLEDVLLKHLILRSVAQTILKRTLTFIGTKVWFILFTQTNKCEIISRYGNNHCTYCIDMQIILSSSYKKSGLYHNFR